MLILKKDVLVSTCHKKSFPLPDDVCIISGNISSSKPFQHAASSCSVRERLLLFSNELVSHNSRCENEVVIMNNISRKFGSGFIANDFLWLIYFCLIDDLKVYN